MFSPGQSGSGTSNFSCIRPHSKYFWLCWQYGFSHKYSSLLWWCKSRQSPVVWESTGTRRRGAVLHRRSPLPLGSSHPPSPIDCPRGLLLVPGGQTCSLIMQQYVPVGAAWVPTGPWPSSWGLSLYPPSFQASSSTPFFPLTWFISHSYKFQNKYFLSLSISASSNDSGAGDGGERVRPLHLWHLLTSSTSSLL